MSLSCNSDKEISSHTSEVFDDVNKDFKEAFDILNRATNKVRKEKEALDEAAKKLEQVHFPKMIDLNVGGHHFSTSLETVKKDPGNFTILNAYRKLVVQEFSLIPDPIWF